MIASARRCYTKIMPPPPPPPRVLPGFGELTANGYNGPCRLSSPTDFGLEAFGDNKIQNPTINCDVCADMCRRNVNATGQPYECVAFECTPSLDHPDAPARAGGPMCELWSMSPLFVFNDACREELCVRS